MATRSEGERIIAAREQLVMAHAALVDEADASTCSGGELISLAESVAVVETGDPVPTVGAWCDRAAELVGMAVVRFAGEYREAESRRDGSSCHVFERIVDARARLRLSSIVAWFNPSDAEYVSDLGLLSEACSRSVAESAAGGEAWARARLLQLRVDNLIKKSKSLMSGEYKKIMVSYDESRRVHDEQVRQLGEIVSLHEVLRDALVAKLGGGLDEVERARCRIEVLQLRMSIESKKKYISVYERRKAKVEQVTTNLKNT